MKELIEKGLMFGNLVHVQSRALISRYNRALTQLSGRETALTDFHIDISGFSPEIADELGDPLYLNPHGVNRQFILLVPEQMRAPLLDAKFSFSREILRDYMAENTAAIFALTAKDAIAGELLNSVVKLSSPNALLRLKRVEVEADTTDETLRQANELAVKIDHLMQDPDAWQDDVLIAEMIGLAKKTGDISRNPVLLKPHKSLQQSFWTAHFGGAFLFRVGDDHVVIARDPAQFEGFHGPVIDLNDHDAVAQFLTKNNLVEPILRGKGRAGTQILRRKMAFLLAKTAAENGETLDRGMRGMRALAREYYHELSDAYRGLDALCHWAEDHGPWPRITSDHGAYFHSLRAADTELGPLVNRLLAALTLDDPLQLFICHKEAFYIVYRHWPEAYQRFVADQIEEIYLQDKSGLRDDLYAHDRQQSRIDAVGPWGALRR